MQRYEIRVVNSNSFCWNYLARLLAHLCKSKLPSVERNVLFVLCSNILVASSPWWHSKPPGAPRVPWSDCPPRLRGRGRQHLRGRRWLCWEHCFPRSASPGDPLCSRRWSYLGRRRRCPGPPRACPRSQAPRGCWRRDWNDPRPPDSCLRGLRSRGCEIRVLQDWGRTTALISWDKHRYQSLLVLSTLLRYLCPIWSLQLIEEEPALHLPRPIALELADGLQGGGGGDQGQEDQEGEPSRQHCQDWVDWQWHGWLAASPYHLSEIWGTSTWGNLVESPLYWQSIISIAPHLRYLLSVFYITIFVAKYKETFLNPRGRWCRHKVSGSAIHTIEVLSTDLQTANTLYLFNVS